MKNLKKLDRMKTPIYIQIATKYEPQKLEIVHRIFFPMIVSSLQWKNLHKNCGEDTVFFASIPVSNSIDVAAESSDKYTSVKIFIHRRQSLTKTVREILRPTSASAWGHTHLQQRDSSNNNALQWMLPISVLVQRKQCPSIVGAWSHTTLCFWASWIGEYYYLKDFFQGNFITG